MIAVGAALTLVLAAIAALHAHWGFGGFTSAWRRLTPEQPCATFDVRYYSPRCLAIGTGFAALAITEPLR